MKKTFISLFLLSLIGGSPFAIAQGTTSPVSNYSPNETVPEAEDEISDQTIYEGEEYNGDNAEPVGKDATFPCKHITFKNPKGKKTYDVADINDVSHVYRPNAVKANCFFIISKQEYRLYVYEKVGNDILLAATYPVCYALKTGPKTRTGDSSTPECSYDKPFYISGISNSSSWAHDFKDGRGSFLAYGNWFMRLDLSKSDCHPGCRSNRSIGIHGSSGNPYSVPGNDSEGCIRLRDADIKDLYTRFAQKGTKVVVKPYSQGRLDFEKKAIAKLGKEFKTAKVGYKYYITH